jgi:hypothetical protein
MTKAERIVELEDVLHGLLWVFSLATAHKDLQPEIRELLMDTHWPREAKRLLAEAKAPTYKDNATRLEAIEREPDVAKP